MRYSKKRPKAMNRAAIPAIMATAILTLSSIPYEYHDSRTVEHYHAQSSGPEYATYGLPLLNDNQSSAIHRAASISGTPPVYTAAIAYAETVCGLQPDHPDKWDISDFGLHERPLYHAERVAKWGEYDPEVYQDAALIAALELGEELVYYDDLSLAYSAYTDGRRGVSKHGVNKKYWKRVEEYLRMCGMEVE